MSWRKCWHGRARGNESTAAESRLKVGWWSCFPNCTYPARFHILVFLKCRPPISVSTYHRVGMFVSVLHSRQLLNTTITMMLAKWSHGGSASRVALHLVIVVLHFWIHTSVKKRNKESMWRAYACEATSAKFVTYLSLGIKQLQ